MPIPVSQTGRGITSRAPPSSDSRMSDRILDALEHHLPDRAVLAVSGGRDSMVLLDAAARAVPHRIACVATLDHGPGVAARRAAAHVVRAAHALGLPVEHGHAPPGLVSEAQWRAARFDFLRDVVERTGGTAVTAHTRDDQVETVLMRVLRATGPRGLAALYAHSIIARPLLDLSRAELADYAERHRVYWVEDTTNQSRRHLRNRVRLDLLPALLLARPALAEDLLALARRAAALREELDEVVDRVVEPHVSRRTVQVARSALAAHDASALALLWQSIAERVGLALDRRGTARAATFTMEGRNGSRIPLSAGWEVALHRDIFHLRPARNGARAAAALPLEEDVSLDGWRFRRTAAPPRTLWEAALPSGVALAVRAWRPGDRMIPHGAAEPRRVKGLLRDAGIDAARRIGWPVVLAANEIVWIPGVRRSSAATVRPGRPVVRYLCEPLDC